MSNNSSCLVNKLNAKLKRILLNRKLNINKENNAKRTLLENSTLF